MGLDHWHSSWTWVLAGLGRRWSREGLAFGSQGEVQHLLSFGSRGPGGEGGGGGSTLALHPTYIDSQP